MRRLRNLAVPFVRAVVLGALTAAVALTTHSVLYGAYPGPNGPIYFSSNRSGNYDLWRMNADGSDAVNLTNSSIDEFDPQPSPDGTRVAYRLNGDIWVIHSDGSAATQLTTLGGDEPYWSPDGSKILFSSARDGAADIYLMNADGSLQTRLTFGGGRGSPQFSPDGSRIVYTNTDGGTYEIHVMNGDGTNDVQLTNHPAYDFLPSFSPDGTRIAWMTQRDGNFEIYVMNADGSNPVNLTNSPDDDSHPDWSPDGTLIAFHSHVGGGDAEIMVMNPDGTNAHPVTLDSTIDARPRWARGLPTPPPSTYAATVQPPISTAGNSVFRANRGVVPVKFTLSDDGAPTCDLPAATISVTRTAGTVVGEVNQSEYAHPSDNGINFRISDCQYVYSLSASSLGTGTYRVDIRIDNSVVGSAMFALH